MFLCPTRNAFYHVTRRCWQWWEGEGGGSVLRQLFPISTQSSAVSQSQPCSEGSRGKAAEWGYKDTLRPKYFQLEGHPNLFSHSHTAHWASQACSPSITYNSEARGERVAAIWESLRFFLIVSCLFTPNQLCCSALSLSALARLPWLVQALSPPPVI